MKENKKSLKNHSNFEDRALKDYVNVFYGEILFSSVYILTHIINTSIKSLTNVKNFIYYKIVITLFTMIGKLQFL